MFCIGGFGLLDYAEFVDVPCCTLCVPSNWWGTTTAHGGSAMSCRVFPQIYRAFPLDLSSSVWTGESYHMLPLWSWNNAGLLLLSTPFNQPFRAFLFFMVINEEPLILDCKHWPPGVRPGWYHAGKATRARERGCALRKPVGLKPDTSFTLLRSMWQISRLRRPPEKRWDLVLVRYSPYWVWKHVGPSGRNAPHQTVPVRNVYGPAESQPDCRFEPHGLLF